MKNPLELIQFGKEISDEYIRGNHPLTDSLEKIAQVHGLNKQEMYRVAETANIETYLKVIDKSDDKYVDFPLANAGEAYERLTAKTAELTVVKQDEFADLAPRVSFSFNLYNKGVPAEITKVAEKIVNIPELFEQADRLNGTLEFISNSFMEETVKLASDYDKIYDITKQTILGGIASLSAVEETTKIASPTCCDNLLLNLRADLKKIMPLYDFEKEASVQGTVNKNSELYQAVLNYDSRVAYITKIAAAFDEYEKAFEAVNTNYKLGITKKAGKGLKIAGGIALGALGLGVLGVAKGAQIAAKQTKAGVVLNKFTAGQAMMAGRQLM